MRRSGSPVTWRCRGTSIHLVCPCRPRLKAPRRKRAAGAAAPPRPEETIDHETHAMGAGGGRRRERPGSLYHWRRRRSALAASIVRSPLTMAAVADDAVAPEAGTPPAAAKTASKNVRIVFTGVPSSKTATASSGKHKLGGLAPH